MDNGAITLTAPASGYRYKLTTGSSQAAAASYSTLDLTIALGCDINSEPTGIASAMVTLINAITGKVVAAPVGAGTGILGILPSSFTALQYGSTAAMTLSGNPTDYMPSIVVQTVRGGALGTATIKWTIDGQVGPAPATSTLSAETLVPASGIVALSGANFTSGLTATFTGVLEGPGAGAGVRIPAAPVRGAGRGRTPGAARAPAPPRGRPRQRRSRRSRPVPSALQRQLTGAPEHLVQRAFPRHHSAPAAASLPESRHRALAFAAAQGGALVTRKNVSTHTSVRWRCAPRCTAGRSASSRWTAPPG